MPWEASLIYPDDTILHAKSFSDKLRLQAPGLKLMRATFPGHVVSIEGTSSDLEKISAVCDWPTPMAPKQLRALLELCSLYHRSILRGFTGIAKPLYN